MYALKWQTVYVLDDIARGLFWCLFLELHSNEGNKHQNNTQIQNESKDNNFHTSTPCITC